MEVKSELFTPPGVAVATSRAGGGGGGTGGEEEPPWLPQSCAYRAQYLKDGPQAVYLAARECVCVNVCTCGFAHLCVMYVFEQRSAHTDSHSLGSRESPMPAATQWLQLSLLFAESSHLGFNIVPPQKTSVGDLCGYTNYKYLQ